MSKQTIEVEVPDDMEVFFVSKPEEYDAFDDQVWRSCQIGLRKKWQYPEWLGGAGVAMDSDGSWHVHFGDPQRHSGGCLGVWFANYGDNGEMERDCTDLSRFPLWTPPPCDDWRESWHPNPRA